MESYTPNRQVAKAFLDLEAVPLLGHAPPFPWKEVLADLKELFSFENLTAEAAPPAWKEDGDIEEGLGGQIHRLEMVCAPLSPSFGWLIAEEDLRILMGALIKNRESAAALYDSDLQAGFFHFIALEVMRAAEKAGFPGTVGPRITEGSGTFSGPVLATDIAITLDGQTARGRLLLPAPFVQAWREHFATQPAQPIKSDAEFNVGVEVGRVDLPQNTLRKLSAGDFVVLDECPYDPDAKEGSVRLSVEGHGLLDGTLSAEGIRIQE